jgi:hypothetical protein
VAINENPGPGEGVEQPTGDDTAHTGAPDPAGGGCFRLGWGCLPVIAGVLALPGSLLL